VDVELTHQVPANRLARAALEEDIIGHHDGAPAVHLQKRLDMLKEVQLLVLGGRPEVLALVAGVLLLQLAGLVDDGDGALLAERRVGQHHAEALPRVRGQRVHARTDGARLRTDAPMTRARKHPRPRLLAPARRALASLVL
jgi:hypothetical protein